MSMNVAAMSVVSPEQFAFLQSVDTPTVCNLVEMVAPERRGRFYTVQHLHCPFPDLAPMIGFARTVAIKARETVASGDASYMRRRLDYLDYLAAEPRPTIAVIEDLDDPPGYGAFWGEVQSNVHKALGCLGTITNGSVRDIPAIPAGFQMLAGSIGPSHAYVHVEDFGGEVNVHGMTVKSGELIHADRHGAVVVRVEAIDAMKPALEKLLANEARIIGAARAPGASVETIKAAMHG
jgi:regulator of RNase E activity RraA